MPPLRRLAPRPSAQDAVESPRGSSARYQSRGPASAARRISRDVASTEARARRGAKRGGALDQPRRSTAARRRVGSPTLSREELARRQPANLLGASGYIATAEDTIIAKLEWANAGKSERQLRDVEGILDISGPQLDIGYIDRWAAELGVSELWERARIGDSQAPKSVIGLPEKLQEANAEVRGGGVRVRSADSRCGRHR